MSSWLSLILFLINLFINFSLSYYQSNSNYVNETSEEGFCLASTNEPYLYFASKTSYNAVYYRDNVEVIPSECQPRQLWMLVRHGARFPLRKKMESFHELHNLRNRIVHNHEHHHRGELCNEDIENLKQWTTENIPLSKSDQLAKQGYDNLKGIGDRIWNKYKGLFRKSYSEKEYKIQYTNHSKTKHSAEAFTTGVFGRKINIPTPNEQDLLTRIYPSCKVKPLPDANDPDDAGKRERGLFKEGPVVAEMVRNVSRRLGFTHSLTIDEVENMYEMCRYRKSWTFEELSPWCACFLERDFQVLEYIADLSYYYNSGHGYSANLRTGCPLVQDMMSRFRDLVVNRFSDEPKALFYFGHSTTLYNFFARAGIAKDLVRITHENYYNMTNRKWRTSILGPFSGNFAGVLLKCDSGLKNRVVFYHNEIPFKFKECHGYICSWDVLEKMFGNMTNPSTCNFDFCDNNQPPYNESSNDINIVENKTDSLFGFHSANENNGGKISTNIVTERSNTINIGKSNDYEDSTNRNRIFMHKVKLINDNSILTRINLTKDTNVSTIVTSIKDIELKESDLG